VPAHRHGAPDADPSSIDARAARTIRIAVAICIAAVLVGIVALWPSGTTAGADPLGLQDAPQPARVLAIQSRQCDYAPEVTCEYVAFEISSGAFDGERGEFERGSTTRLSAGDRILITRTEARPGQLSYGFWDFQRSTPMIWLVLIFAVAVIALGRWRGVGALVGLAASLFFVVWFALPSLVDGNDAVAVALVTAGAVAVIALYLAHGVNPATDVALLSTFASLMVTALLAHVFVRVTKLTGYTDDATFVLDALGTGIDARGVLLAGIVIGSLGVLDDVTVTQVAAVRELHAGNPDQPSRQLFASAMAIGRDHISSTVNTLFLAYAGAALPLLLLFSSAGASVSDVTTREIVAVEIVRALVGSIGLVASVPISTWLAMHVLTRRVREARRDPAET
jgi:uncharacterized membrane protein